MSRLLALTCLCAAMAACDARAYYKGYSQGKKYPAVSVRSDHTRLAVQAPETVEPPAPGPVLDGAGSPAFSPARPADHIIPHNVREFRLLPFGPSAG